MLIDCKNLHQTYLHQTIKIVIEPALAIFGPFVYRLGRLIFNQERRVRLP